MTITLMPTIFPENVDVSFLVSGLMPSTHYQVVFRSSRERYEQISARHVSNASGVLHLEQRIAWRGEILVDLFPAGAPTPLATLHGYAAPAALASRIPLKLDFHIHTQFSDGKQSPLEMILTGRENGLDALAITDHNYYPSSLEAIQAAREVQLGLLCFPGEEVSLEAVHILSIGASAGVGNQPPRTGYAGLRTAVDQVHQSGGKAYLAHPFWRLAPQHNHLPTSHYFQVLKENIFDGVELLGDVEWEDNLRSLVFYSDLPAGQRPPILGNSDTHSRTHTYNSYWTLVLATERSHTAVLEAIADHFSTACMRAPLEPAGSIMKPRMLAFGDFEQVELALFLDQYFFPAHDVICREESSLARRLSVGEPIPPMEFTRVQTAMADLFANYWFKG
ncbi:MAG TPA: CehA/McbA family metallohydrolase [Anaerolineaceae bacterium]